MSEGRTDEPDFTIVTPSFNAARTIAKTLQSVRNQVGITVEHIVVDGGSSDGTPDLVRSSPYRPDVLVSEPDEGLYDAINKGLLRSKGRHVAILNADDRYADPQVLATYLRTLQGGAEAVFSDLAYVASHAVAGERPVRIYRSSRFRPSRMRWGWMPAHPTLAVTRGLIDRVGLYRTDYKIAADFEWCIRAFVIEGCTYSYIPMRTVLMSMGGLSTSGYRATALLNREVLRACRENGLRSSPLHIASKYPLKAWDRLHRRDAQL